MGRQTKEERRQAVNGEGWRRRHAIQLAGMLPPDPRDARIVLDLMREFHEKFMVPPTEKIDGGSGNVRELKRR